MPKGKYMATVKVGEKGQIVIPKGARELFGIEPGDTLLLMADVKQGIAIVQNDAYMKFVDAVFSVQQEPPVAPDGELDGFVRSFPLITASASAARGVEVFVSSYSKYRQEGTDLANEVLDELGRVRIVEKTDSGQS